jgi:AcrR family transcriptional regulator
MKRIRSQSRTDDLIRAGTRVFLEKSYRRAQVSDVAREMGVAPGTIYLYVESKEALFDLILRASLDANIATEITLPVATRRPEEILVFIQTELAAESRIESLERALVARRPRDPAAELASIVRELYTRASRRWLSLKLIERSAPDWPELAALWFGGHRLRLLEQLSRYLQMRMKSQVLRPAPNPTIAARLILELVATFAIHCRTEPEAVQADQAQAEETVIDAVIHAYTFPTRGDL